VLLQAALSEVGDYPCHIDAQTYLAEMYGHHGFIRDGDEFLEDGIPHVADGKSRVPPPKPSSRDFGGRSAGGTPHASGGRTTRESTGIYPFSAIVGHDRLRLALLLCAVRPEIGGVLIRGEKGTAKSTAVRGLAHVVGRGGRRVACRAAHRRDGGPRGRIAGPAEGAA